MKIKLNKFTFYMGLDDYNFDAVVEAHTVGSSDLLMLKGSEFIDNGANPISFKAEDSYALLPQFYEEVLQTED